MKKYLKDLVISEISSLRADYAVLKLRDSQPLPEIRPGQFVEVWVDDAVRTFLRRPISVNFVDYDKNELWLLIHGVGEGTRKLISLKAGNTVSCLFPLGNGFPMPRPEAAKRLLLVGGGVGTAPLLYYGKSLRDKGHEPEFLLGGRRKEDIMQVEEFKSYGPVHITTEDGSWGTKGFVTNHEILTGRFDAIAMCGPKPMMQAVAQSVRAASVPCYASLENMMACGLGACLCCVEKTKQGHLCVCKDGPVFDVRDLNW